MARNEQRRAALADAGLRLLAREGARGLTHRAVDAEAGAPIGTASNYFASREALVGGLVERLGERLAPDPEVHAALARRTPDAALFADYLRDIIRRLLADRDLPIALIELRLEAARRPTVAEALGPWMRDAFARDVEFNEAAGLPGGSAEIALFHYAIDGLMLDRLTVQIDPGTSTEAIVDALVERLLPA